MPRLTVEEITNLVGGEIVCGNASRQLRVISPLDRADGESLAFVTKGKYLSQLANTDAAAVLISSDLLEKAGTKIASGLTLIQVARPYLAFAQAAQAFAPEIPCPVGIHESAVIDPSAQLGSDVRIGPFVYIGPGAVLGEAAVLYPGVHLEAKAQVGAGTIVYNHAVIRHGCRVGVRCIIHSGVIIGSDGFGFAQDPGESPDDLECLRHVKIPQLGDVVVEDDVEIGSNSCVDRGALGTTKIMSGTKIDNLVQIGHNVEVGKNCIIVAQSGVAGSSRLNTAVTLAAQSGIAGHLEIGKGALVYGQSGVAHDVAEGEKVMGSPSMPAATFFRNSVHFSKLGKLMSRVKKLEKKIWSEE